ncbi:MAG: hypothetical protein JW729_00105, partial [Bacteroidales bacterium]|nr:hypothetical protein [Bacteroidales bacterium]
WVAEIKIPFSQLRFSSISEQIWGLQVKRYVYRKEERSLWQHISNTQNGYVSLFGELHGLKDIKPKRQFDITPYAVASYESFQAEKGDPFTDGKESQARIGLDAKIGLTNNLTLDLTINPDFGQVEADPSEVNLSAFESYFREKRLFFIEGRNIYNFPLRLDNGNDNLFYSRRIGRRPSYYPEEYSYANAPNNTSILGAAKITGRTKNGWSIGILESLTNVEFASFAYEDNTIQEIKVEPLTNYFVSRVEKDYHDGNTKIGGIFTATNRQILDDHLKTLPNSAYTGGANFEHSWNNKKYTFSVKLMGSSIHGDTLAIQELQTSSSRYYQRPDADHMEYNPNLTNLSGHAGSAWFGKFANSGWSYILWYSWQSPGFEINDLGYLRAADDMTQMAWTEYKFPKPFSVFRRLSMEASQYSSYDFSGKYLGFGGDLSLQTQFTNFWSISMGGGYGSKSLEKTLLRGGPLFLKPQGIRLFGHFSSDRKFKLSTSMGISFYLGDENYRKQNRYSIGLTYRPLEQLMIDLTPSINISKNALQYIDVLSINGQDNYFLAEIKQKTFVTSLRLDYSINPDFSIQFYAQPFISSAEYSNFKHVTNPTASNYSDRFNNIVPDDEYGVDIDFDQQTDGYLYNPDFKFLQFQSNLVARWEYRPGSILYLVWSQGKTDYPEQYTFDISEDIDTMFNLFPNNVFLMKLSYRIPI